MSAAGMSVYKIQGKKCNLILKWKEWATHMNASYTKHVAL